MNMQKSTALRLVIEIKHALDNTGDTSEDITLSDVAIALIKDAIARSDLVEAINHESTS